MQYTQTATDFSCIFSAELVYYELNKEEMLSQFFTNITGRSSFALSLTALAGFAIILKYNTICHNAVKYSCLFIERYNTMFVLHRDTTGV